VFVHPEEENLGAIRFSTHRQSITPLNRRIFSSGADSSHSSDPNGV
jgi:hypothetical protein